MSRAIKANTPAAQTELSLTNGAVVMRNAIGVHPNLQHDTLYSNIFSEQTGFGLYAIPFDVIRTHDSGCAWYVCEATAGVYNFDRLHALIDPLIASGKRILYVLTDAPNHAVAGNIKQRWTAGKSLVTGNALSNMVFPTVANRNSRMYEVTTAGTSGTSEPVWPTAFGATVNAVGGTAVYTCRQFPTGSTHTPGYNTTKAGDVSYGINGTTLAPAASALTNFINAVYAEFGAAIYGFEFGNESSFDMQDNGGALVGSSAFNISDEETFVSNAYVAKAAIAALPTAVKPVFGGSGWVGNPNAVDNLKRFLLAKDPVTGKYGYEIGFDWHSTHIYGSYDVGKYGVSGQIQGMYSNIRAAIKSFAAVLNEYGITNPKFRITEYGVSSTFSGIPNANYTALNALSAADQLTVVKMRTILALCIPNVIGLDFYNHKADFNTDFRTANSPIRQALAWLDTIYCINWAKQNPVTGQLTVNVQYEGNVGAGTTETFNYPAGWANYYW